MATVATASPSVTVVEQRPGVSDPDQPGNIAGQTDLSTAIGWSQVASFVWPVSVGGPDLDYDQDGPSVTIGQGFVSRSEPAGDGQEIIKVSQSPSISLNADTTHYVYWTASDEWEIRDQDNPPSPQAFLAGIVDTTDNRVKESTRGRSPVSLFQGGGNSAGLTCCAPLLVETEEPDSIADTSAVINGRLNGLGGREFVKTYFQYRKETASSWSETSKEKTPEPGPFDFQLTGLSTGTTYVYRAVALPPNSPPEFGQILSFITTDDGTTNPSVQTDQATNVGETTATLNGELTDLGSYSSATLFFQYRVGSDQKNNNTAGQDVSSTQTFSEALNGLTPNTKYEFRACAGFDNGTVCGDFKTFETAAPSSSTELAVTTGSASGITDTTATLNGSVDSFGQGASAAYYMQVRPKDSAPDGPWTDYGGGFITVPQSVSVDVDGLPAGVTYQYRLCADNFTQEKCGSIKDFTTDFAGSKIIDDFEDADITVKPNDWTGWSGATGDLTAQQGTVISGMYSGELFSANDSSDSIVSASPDNTISLTNFTCSMITKQTSANTGNDWFEVRIINGTGDNLGVRFKDDGTYEIRGSNSMDATGSYTQDVTHQVEFYDWDSSAGTVECRITSGGGTVADVTVDQYGSDLSGIEFESDASDAAGDSITGYFDDVKIEV